MTSRLHVVALTGGHAVPSARFRVGQLVPALAAAGVDIDVRASRLTSFPPRRRWLRPLWLPATLAARLPDIAATRRAQVTLLQREFVSTLATLEGLTARPRVLDVDDAIWLNRGDGGFARRLAGTVDLVVAGNEFVADWFGRHCRRVVVLPTAVDTARFVPGPPEIGAGRIRPLAVGWTGSSANFPYLAMWEDALATVMAAKPDLRVRICADRRPPFRQLPPGRIDWVPWSPEVEVPFLQSLDVGLMPLSDSAWARGKCSYKMLLYLACGVPAVVSPVGMNRQVLDAAPVGYAAVDGAAAADAIVTLLEDDGVRRELGQAGRALVLKEYAVDVVAPSLAAHLRSVIGGSGLE